MLRTASLLLAVLFFGAFLLAANPTTDFSGHWDGRHVRAGDGFPVEPSEPATLTLVQNGDTITGEYSEAGGKPAAIQGKIVDGKIMFWLRSVQNFLVTAQLTLDGDLLQGRLTMSNGFVTNVVFKKQ